MIYILTIFFLFLEGMVEHVWGNFEHQNFEHQNNTIITFQKS